MAFLLDALDGRVRSPIAIAEYLGLPLLAVMPAGRRGPASGGRHDDASEEACRVLLAAHSGTSGSASGSLLVTGAANPSTYSSIAANLAHTSARSGRDTVLVDLGFRNPSLTRLMGVQGHAGVTDVLLSGASIADASVPIPPGNGETADIAGRLRFLPVGTESANAGDLIGSLAVKEMIERLASGDTRVIVDSGATLEASEAISAADFVEHVLFVAATDTARQDALADARRRLDLATAKPIGVAVIEVAG
jgi:Mrp family chromosome partitioning ATPase